MMIGLVAMIFFSTLILLLPPWHDSVVPKELESGSQPGQGTDVKLVDKQNEEYVAPAYVAFGGDGQTMG